MGLDISHDTWHGAYSAFMAWRKKISELAGLPPLMLMEGFYDGDLSDKYTGLPIKWDCLKHTPLIYLLNHSDCDGYINWRQCKDIATALERLLPLMNEDMGGHIGNLRDKTQLFINGLNHAYANKEKLIFR